MSTLAEVMNRIRTIPDPDQQRDSLFETLASCEDVDHQLKLEAEMEEPSLEERLALTEAALAKSFALIDLLITFQFGPYRHREKSLEELIQWQRNRQF